MSRSQSVYLEDIIESIDFIFSYLENKTEHDFINEMLLQDAVIRRFEIIGEASSKVSESLKASYPEVKWKLMKGMRNRLVHEYFGVMADTVYRTIYADLPVLKEQLLKILK